MITHTNKTQGTQAEPGRTGSRFFAPAFVQTKLTVNEPGDQYEQEADAMADKVMRMATPFAATGGADEPFFKAGPGMAGLQRKCKGCEEEEKLHRKGDSAAVQPSAAVQQTLQSSGQPLDTSTRSFMEQRFGHNFGQVQIHNDPVAHRSSADIQACAYTHQNHIVFGTGQYQPQSEAGKHLLAHELTHVVQQGNNNIPSVQRQSGPPPTPPLVHIPPRVEPHCPGTSTGLGNLVPVPDCNPGGEDQDGEPFHFCNDSDVLINQAELNRLFSFAQRQPSLTQFHVQAYASVDGPGGQDAAALYNLRLSCHRGKRIGRELLNAGVVQNSIDIAAMGPTERFGAGAANRPLNRVVVVGVTPPENPTRPTTQSTDPGEIANAARQSLINRQYLLGADAYFARWSCGRFSSLGEAVERTNVVVRSTSITTPATREIGSAGFTGQNTIFLDSRIADAADPIGCAANRIADLTFHHFSRPYLPNQREQHEGGLHMLFLGGFNACVIPQDPFGAHNINLSVPLQNDPKAGLQPPCADMPLQGALTPQQQHAGTAPVFTAATITPAPIGGSLVPSTNSRLSVGMEISNSIQLSGQVTVAGNPREIANYEIGFLQTVMTEDQVMTYLDGRKVVYRFPLPLRDGAPHDAPTNDPPWFDNQSKSQAQPGTVSASLTDTPNFRVFRFFPDPSQTDFVVGGPFQGQNLEFSNFIPHADRKDLPDRGHRNLTFNTWLVARRKDAPATIDSTIFLTGLNMELDMEGSWIGRNVGGFVDLTGTGSYTFTTSPAAQSDQNTIKLRGATPDDFVSPQGVPLFNEILQFEGPTPMAQAGGLNLSQYHQQVNTIARPFRTTPALRQELIAGIMIDFSTGRVVLDDLLLSGSAIQIRTRSGTPLPDADRQQLEQAIFPEVRKLIAGRLGPNLPSSPRARVSINLDVLP